MLACTETVSFVRLVKGEDDDAYVITTIRGVSWFNKTRIKAEGTGVVYDNVVYVRIPASALPGGWLPAEGDHVFLGRPSGGITTPAALAAYKPRKVLTVGDNRRGRLAHVAVIGK